MINQKEISIIQEYATQISININLDCTGENDEKVSMVEQYTRVTTMYLNGESEESP